MSSYLKGIHPAEFARWCPVMALWLSIIIRRKCFLICQHELLTMWKECVCFWRKVLGEENGEGGLPRRRRTLAASVRTQIPSLGASMASHGLPCLSVRLSGLLLISLLSRTAKVTRRLVRIRERHPFLPAAGGGCAPQPGQKNSTECSFHSLLGQASLFSEQHTALCSGPGFALLSLIPLQGCGGCRYSRSRGCSPNSMGALGMWSPTWHVLLELLLSKPGPHGKLPASHLLSGHCRHQLCLLETRTLSWVSAEFIGSCFVYRCLKYLCVITELAAILINRLFMLLQIHQLDPPKPPKTPLISNFIFLFEAEVHSPSAKTNSVSSLGFGS